MNAEWEQWRREIFGDPFAVWHDGPDFGSMLAAARSDPAGTVRMLRLGLADGDPLAAQGFTELATTGRTPADLADLLRAALAGTDGGDDDALRMRIRLGEALFAATADPRWSGPIVEVLLGPGSEFVRLEAAMALAQFPRDDELVAALRQAVHGDAYLVRYHAANTLLRYAASADEVSAHRTLLDKITSDDPADWHAAADQFR